MASPQNFITESKMGIRQQIERGLSPSPSQIRGYAQKLSPQARALASCLALNLVGGKNVLGDTAIEPGVLRSDLTFDSSTGHDSPSACSRDWVYDALPVRRAFNELRDQGIIIRVRDDRGRPIEGLITLSNFGAVIFSYKRP